MRMCTQALSKFSTARAVTLEFVNGNKSQILSVIVSIKIDQIDEIIDFRLIAPLEHFRTHMYNEFN